eukprot:CAMPEP_0179157454 /NCGR_PEP_ID=MMETSP0796-20121207/76797_1 /TAXON_ID=73915 /ORGANISM="Pyrodinium bahamense, Strain pbaha01" /LENGTH=54 /DNA_ID=CAMNT_0020859083 /DNA_START=291 /DNA_END=452 /DNA_ORIENTATION=-
MGAAPSSGCSAGSAPNAAAPAWAAAPPLGCGGAANSSASLPISCNVASTLRASR